MVLLELSIFKLLAVLNREAASFWRGEVFALGRSIAEAAKFRGVEVSDYFVICKRWGLAGEASPQRREEAHADMGNSYTSLHLFTRHPGFWPVRWLVAQSELPWAWIGNKRVCLALKLPMEMMLPGPLSSRSKENAQLT